MVLFYSRPNCAPCRPVKEWLTRKGIAFKEFNLDDTKAEFRTTPTLVIGEQVIIGPNYPRMIDALKTIGILV